MSAAKSGIRALTSGKDYATIIKRAEIYKMRPAGVAHLVERRLAKAEVAGSSPVSRSIASKEGTAYPCFINRRHSQAVRQRSAKPSSPVRFRVAPPLRKPQKCLILGIFEAIYFPKISFLATFWQPSAKMHLLASPRCAIHSPLKDVNKLQAWFSHRHAQAIFEP